MTSTALKTLWKIDAAHTEAGFAVKHLMISTVRGRFAGLDGTIEFDPSDFGEASVNIVIDAGSIDTSETRRDEHLRSSDFFDVQRYPRLTFSSTAVRNIRGTTFQLVGNLTIKDVTREVVFDVESNGLQRDPWGGERAGFSARTTISRKDFGLGWNQVLETGGLLVGDDVKINLDVELLRA